MHLYDLVVVYEGEKVYVCPLNSKLKLSFFDNMFNGAYREHTFLSHPLVTNSVKESMYGPVLIITTFAQTHIAQDINVHKFTPKNELHGMSDEEIVKAFHSISESVLHFHSLYDSFFRFTNNSTNDDFNRKIKNGLIRGAYKQL